jgi:hypothetical protein
MFLIVSFVVLALSSAPKSVDTCQAADRVTQTTSDILHENVIPLLSAQAQDEPKGCCCIARDSGPPEWNCSGSTPGTMQTKKQCADEADSVGARYKWHEGQCKDNE